MSWFNYAEITAFTGIETLLIEQASATKSTTLDAIKSYINDTPAYINAYLPAPEALIITAGTPESPTGFVAKYSNLFTYSNGSLTYNGPDAIVKIDGAISLTSTTNNVTVTVSFGLNGVASSDSEIDRKVATGADVGAVPLSAVYSLTSGDVLDFYVDTNASSTITLTKANITIHELARL